MSRGTTAREALGSRGVLLLIAVLTAACAPRPADRVSKDLKLIEGEQAPDKLLERGRAFANLGDLSRAEQYIAASIHAGADPRVALPLLLRVCIEAKRYRVAIDYAEPFLRKNPGDYKLRSLLASLYAIVGDVEGARTSYEEVIAANPDDSYARYALGVLFRDVLLDRVRADVHFRAYLRIEPKGVHADEARASLLKAVP